MKKIGILGGMAPESTLEYYRQIIQLSQKILPERHYPVIIIYSLNMAEFRKPLSSGDTRGAISILLDAINSLYKAGAEFAVIASNTPYMFFQHLAEKSPIPLLNVIDEVAKEADKRGFKKVGLYGTKFSMEGNFFQKSFKRFGIEVVPPDTEDIDYIHIRVMGELADGKVIESTRKRFIKISQKMVQEKGVQALILGSTELPLILNEKVLKMPVLDTTRIGIQKTFDYALSERE
jgi:aspartate racemase